MHVLWVKWLSQGNFEFMRQTALEEHEKRYIKLLWKIKWKKKEKKKLEQRAICRLLVEMENKLSPAGSVQYHQSCKRENILEEQLLFSLTITINSLDLVLHREYGYINELAYSCINQKNIYISKKFCIQSNTFTKAMLEQLFKLHSLSWSGTNKLHLEKKKKAEQFSFPFVNLVTLTNFLRSSKCNFQHNIHKLTITS